MGKHNAPPPPPPSGPKHTDGQHSDSRTAKDTGYVGTHRTRDGRETQK